MMQETPAYIAATHAAYENLERAQSACNAAAAANDKPAYDSAYALKRAAQDELWQAEQALDAAVDENRLDEFLASLSGQPKLI